MAIRYEDIVEALEKELKGVTEFSRKDGYSSFGVVTRRDFNSPYDSDVALSLHSDEPVQPCSSSPPPRITKVPPDALVMNICPMPLLRRR